MRCACASHLCEHGVHLEVRNTARDGEERPRSRQAPRRLHDTQHFLWIRRHVDYDERRVAELHHPCPLVLCGVVASGLHVGKVEHAVARLVAVSARRARQLKHPIDVHMPESGGDLVGQFFV